MNIITQEAKKKQAAVKFAKKNGKSAASRMYGVKRWCNRYDGTDWHSLVERSRRPHHNPNRHTKKEERKIKKAFENNNVLLILEKPDDTALNRLFFQ